MIKDNYELEILVNGKPVKEYFHESKFYIEGKEDTKYTLRVKNNGYRRIVVVPTVDGLNVLTGKVASYSDRGYIVSGHNSMVIDGWRTSDKEVAEFLFSDPGSSYASKKGRGSNLGVIGCAVFKEVDMMIPDMFIYVEKTEPYKLSNSTSAYFSTKSHLSGQSLGMRSVNTSSASNYDAAFSAQSLGTGFGDRKKSEVTTVSFDREDHPSEVFEIFYNTRKQLEKIGINLNSRPQYVAPSAFPAENGYCEPPEK